MPSLVAVHAHTNRLGLYFVSHWGAWSYLDFSVWWVLAGVWQVFGVCCPIGSSSILAYFLCCVLNLYDLYYELSYFICYFLCVYMCINIIFHFREDLTMSYNPRVVTFLHPPSLLISSLTTLPIPHQIYLLGHLTRKRIHLRWKHF